jgi:hypothetical protein
MNVTKEEVEQLLGYQITDKLFKQALEYAGRKQEHIFLIDERPVVKQHWYLVKLTEEYARSLAFSRKTMDLCRMRCNMEKEHLVNKTEAPYKSTIL